MITFHDQHGHFQLPTHWGEVLTRQFCDLDRLQCRTVEARASYFAGRPIQVNGAVADALAFLLSGPSPQCGLPYPFDLGQETYLQVETIRQLLAAHPLHEALCDVYGLYVTRWRGFRNPEFSQDAANNLSAHAQGLPITDTYPAIAHCLTELQRLATKYARLAEPDTTEAGRRAREAGADKLQAFGYLPTARWYAQQYGLSLDAAMQVPWETVAVHLLLARDEAEIADQLHKNSSHEQ